MWIKICGLTTSEAVNAAVEARVDAIGFVFAPSKRQVDATRALELTHSVPKSVLRVAVMQHPAQSLVDEVLSVFKPDIVQIDFEDLRELIVPPQQQILPVLRAGRALPPRMPAQILFEGPMSGTGQTADWMRAAELATQTRLILAGGLNADNVEDAIDRVRPFGVDISSGVESAPGVKDVRKIEEFVRTVRAARY